MTSRGTSRARASSDLTLKQEVVLQKYPRAIAHLGRQLLDGRLALAFGAGASRSLGFPEWKALVGRVRDHPDIDGANLTGTGTKDPLPTAAQVLLERFDRRQRAKLRRQVGDHASLHELVEARWRRIVQECLYRDTPVDDKRLAEKDRVYKHYLNVVKRAPVTINYNFDDSLERLLLHTRTDEERTQRRGFEVVVDPRLPFRLPVGNILHLNGYLPANPLETVGDRIVFAEGAFADQLLETIRGANATLLHFLTKNTFLLIGLSLQDENLRHLLRLNAVLNPGHVHYRIHFVDDPDKFDDERAIELADAHFRTFNLVTLFLTDPELAALGGLLSRGSDDLRDLAKRVGTELFYTFYLAGVPGAGKTTCFSHLSSLVAHDEWLEERIPELSPPPGVLPKAELARVDEWVLRQVGLKNVNLSNQSHTPGIGINIVDRCPLDALSFTSDPSKWQQKALALREVIADGMANRRVQPGRVLLLVGDPHDLRIRAFKRDRQSGASLLWIDWLQDATKLTYSGRGVELVNVAGLTIPEMVHRVSGAVYRDSYKECQLDRRLRQYENGTAPVPTRRAPKN